MPSTSATHAPAIRGYVSVGGVERMAAQTLALVGISATANILTDRDRLHVARIHAKAGTTEMIDTQASRDAANEPFIRPAMCLNPSPVIRSISDAEAPVTVAALYAFPEPAFVGSESCYV